MHPTSSIGEPLVEDLRSGQETGTTVILGIFEHEEKVEVTDENADQFHHSASCDDHVEGKEDPGQIHGLELGAEPEIDDHVFVKLTPKENNTKLKWIPNLNV